MDVLNNVVAWLMGLLDTAEQVEVLDARAVRKIAFGTRNARKIARSDGSFASFRQVLSLVSSGVLLEMGLAVMKDRAAEAIDVGLAKRWMNINEDLKSGSNGFTLIDLMNAQAFHNEYEVDRCHAIANRYEMILITRALKQIAGEVEVIILADAGGVMLAS